MCGVYEKPNIILIAKSARYFLCSTCYVGASLIEFHLKGNNIPKSISKKVVQVASSQLFQEICTKSKDIVSSHLSRQKNVVI